MATIFETTGDDREQRIAELKQKMQERAKQAQANAATQESAESTPDVVADVQPVAAAQNNDSVESPVAEAPATVEAVPAESSAAAATTAEAADLFVEEVNEQAAMTRREFLTYAWGAALGLLAVETGLASYFFMYPRFRAGEFGGEFYLPSTEIPSLDAAPSPQTAGKFWLVNTEDEGPKALYMVCTHLGCLYKWQASNNRFECPCHGSKFSKAGFYIEGPAPRSLDRFELTEENGQITVDTGAKITGNPSSESPARAVIA